MVIFSFSIFFFDKIFYLKYKDELETKGEFLNVENDENKLINYYKYKNKLVVISTERVNNFNVYSINMYKNNL